MKHAIQFHADQNPDYLTLDLITEISEEESRALAKSNGAFEVDFAVVPVDFDLLDVRSLKYDPNVLSLKSTIGRQADNKWALSTHLPYTRFHVKNLRNAYVFLRRVMHQIENTLILNIPLSPFFGLTQTFDIRFNVPREVMAYDAFRRSILVR